MEHADSAVAALLQSENIQEEMEENETVVDKVCACYQ